jgi:hypothetical protein
MAYHRVNWKQIARYKKATFRSGFEDKVAAALTAKGIPYEYEQHKISYLVPAQEHTYTPDFLLPNGIFIETKGVFDSQDRKKHLFIKEQYGDGYDIRFVFYNAHAPIYKGSKTTYATWCDKHGFKWAHKSIPEAWIKEPSRGCL